MTRVGTPYIIQEWVHRKILRICAHELKFRYFTCIFHNMCTHTREPTGILIKNSSKMQ